MRRWALHWALAALLVAPATACGDDDGEGAASATTTTISTTTTTTTTATTTTAAPTVTEPTDDMGNSDDPGVSELADGRHFGFWSSFVIGDVSAVGEFDLAYFLTGAEAEAAAAERSDEVDNDYYIVNDNPKLRTLIAKGDTEVRVLAGGGADLEPTNVADFAVERHPESGFWVTVESGIVTAIEEQYVP